MQQHISNKLSILVSNRIMQRVRANIPSKSVQADRLRGSLCPRHFKDTTRDPQTRVCCYNFDACDPLCQLTTLLRSQSGTTGGVGSVNHRDLRACAVCQSLSGAERGEEVAITLEDVEFISRLVLIVATIWPGSSGAGGVLCSKL